MLIAQLLSSIATQGGAKPAFRFLDKETSYQQLKTTVARLSYLYLKEVGPTGRVAFLCSNSPSVVETFFALSNVKALTIPLDPALSDEQLAAIYRETRATHLAVTSDLAQRGRNLMHTNRLNGPVIEIEKKQGGEYDTSYSAPPDKVPLETDVILLLRTSGTSEKPKFIEFTHKQICSAVTALKRPYHVLPTDRFFTTLNWSHPFALTHGILFPVLTGASCLVDHGLEGAELLQFLVKSRTTRLVGAPAFFRKLLLQCVESKHALPGVKSVTVGLGNFPQELKDAFKALKVPVAQCYGQTENLWTISMDDTQVAEGSAAVATSALAGFKYKVVDENGDEIEGKFDRTGQLAISAPSIMKGYVLKDRESSEKATKQVVRGTWLYTGDIAILSGEGDSLQIQYRCRKDETFFQNGRYVWPDKIDKSLKGCPGLSDVAGFVTKNALGQKIIACALVRTLPQAASEKTILDWCKAKLIGDQQPEIYFFVDAIPRTNAGSPNRLALGRQYSGISSG